MKIQTLILAICLLFTLPACIETAAERDFQEGRASYNSGNYREAVKWFRKAAEQGHAEAQNNLGVCYYRGEGVPQDDKEAVYWWRKAAEQGFAAAQNHLGWIYYIGEGVPKHDQTAYMWFLLARANGYTWMQVAFDKLEARLSRAEIAAAQKKAAQMQTKIDKMQAKINKKNIADR